MQFWKPWISGISPTASHIPLDRRIGRTPISGQPARAESASSALSAPGMSNRSRKPEQGISGAPVVSRVSLSGRLGKSRPGVTLNGVNKYQQAIDILSIALREDEYLYESRSAMLFQLQKTKKRIRPGDRSSRRDLERFLKEQEVLLIEIQMEMDGIRDAIKALKA